MSNPFVNIEGVSISIDKSSLITDIAWKRNKSTDTSNPSGLLTLTFKEGAVYEYRQVPSLILQKMLLATSMGSFFHNNIKDQYTTSKKES